MRWQFCSHVYHLDEARNSRLFTVVLSLIFSLNLLTWCDATEWILATRSNLNSMSSLCLTGSYQYKYQKHDNGALFYLSPTTSAYWSWDSSYQLTGTYAYTTDGGAGYSYVTCTGSDETPGVGIGCSNGSGGTTKILPWTSQSYSSYDANAAYVAICQDDPNIFGSNCYYCYIYIGVNCIPTKQPTKDPTNRPTNRPTAVPTNRPTDRPTDRPTHMPTNRPTNTPTNKPTRYPTTKPTMLPSDNPTIIPTGYPSTDPSLNPTTLPTLTPSTDIPTFEPTQHPTFIPSLQPSVNPTYTPTIHPTNQVISTVNQLNLSLNFTFVSSHFINNTNVSTNSNTVETTNASSERNNSKSKDSIDVDIIDVIVSIVASLIVFAICIIFCRCTLHRMGKLSDSTSDQTHSVNGKQDQLSSIYQPDEIEGLTYNDTTANLQADTIGEVDESLTKENSHSNQAFMVKSNIEGVNVVGTSKGDDHDCDSP